MTGGVYRYWRDGVPLAIEEPWAWQPKAGGHRLAGERRVEGVVVLSVSADYLDGQCQTMALDWQPESPKAHRHLVYRRVGETLHWSEPGRARQGRLALPATAPLFPLLRAATGFILRTLACKPQTIALPDLRATGDPERFLKPWCSSRRVIEGAATADGRHYRYFGGEYGEVGADYWLNHGGWVQRYRWAASDGLWEAALLAQ